MLTSVDESRKLRDIEDSYISLIFQSLPVIKIENSPVTGCVRLVKGTIMVLDSIDKEEPYVRSIPSFNLNKNDIHTSAFNEIVAQTLETMKEKDKMRVCSEHIYEALETVFKKIDQSDVQFDDIEVLIEQRAHPLKGSVLDKDIIKPLSRKNELGDKRMLIAKVEKYITKVKFYKNSADKDAFHAILNEVISVMWSIKKDGHADKISKDLIEQICPIVVPFSALGMFRGVAVWFVIGDEEVKKSYDFLKKQFRNLGDVLSATYSHIIIDVCTSYFISKLAESDYYNEEGFSNIAQEAMRYVYPCVDVCLNKEDAEECVDCNSKNHITMNLKKKSVATFLEAKSVTWHLVDDLFAIPFYTCPNRELCSDPEQFRQAYHRLLEEKLEDVALAANNALNRRYSAVLEMYSHDIGTLLKQSGIMTMWSRSKQEDSNVSQDVVDMIDRLMPIWGATQAISLAKKQRDQGWDVLQSWIEKKWGVLYPDQEQEIVGSITDSVVKFIRYGYAYPAIAEHKAPTLPWVVTVVQPNGHKISEKWNWDVIIKETPSIVSLPPFKDNNHTYDKTIGMTTGLREMISNVRKYPEEEHGRDEEHRMLLNQLEEAERTVNINISNQEGSVVVSLVQPYILPTRHGAPHSKSLERVQTIERYLLRGLILTSAPQKVCHVDKKGYIVGYYSQTWTFKWKELLDIYKKQQEEKSGKANFA